MNEDLSRFRDPKTGQALVREGDALLSPSGASYPILGGVPRFVEPENYAADFGLQWKRFPQTQLDSYSGLTITEDRLARCFGGDLSVVRGRRVLEAGSGAGRFTEVLLKHGALLDSFDFSNAVEANRDNNGAHPNLTLAQGDIRAIPYPKESYDFVVCLGVLQHTPDPEESIGKLWEMVAPGGRMVIDHYRWNLWLRLPPPLGDAEKLYRRIILGLPAANRYAAVKKVVDFWFPIFWRLRDRKLLRKVLARIGGIHFYYPDIPLRSREEHYQWALLDSHDGMTDAFKHYRDEHQIRRRLESLGAEDINVWVGGNGVEASCRKAAAYEL